jgi:hypothetical protein
VKGTYIIEYKCGCSDDSKRKKDLLDYCAIHGADKIRIYFVPDILVKKKEVEG